MMKKRTPLENEKQIISSVKKEMDRPRLAESVRNDGKDEAAPVLVADPHAHSEKTRTPNPSRADQFRREGISIVPCSWSMSYLSQILTDCGRDARPWQTASPH
jgi:ribosome biogenesis protein Tsr3